MGPGVPVGPARVDHRLPRRAAALHRHRQRVGRSARNRAHHRDRRRFGRRAAGGIAPAGERARGRFVCSRRAGHRRAGDRSAGRRGAGRGSDPGGRWLVAIGQLFPRRFASGDPRDAEWHRCADPRERVPRDDRLQGRRRRPPGPWLGQGHRQPCDDPRFVSDGHLPIERCRSQHLRRPGSRDDCDLARMAIRAHQELAVSYPVRWLRSSWRPW